MFVQGRDMRRTFEFRLYPKPEQEAALLKTLGLCQNLYNAMLWQRQMAWSRQMKLSRFDQERQLSELRQENPDYGAVYTHVLQDVARRLDLAFKAFFRRCKAGEKPGDPRFRARDRYDSITFKEPSNGSVRISGNRVSFSKVVENVRCFFHRPLLGTVAAV